MMLAFGLLLSACGSSEEAGGNPPNQNANTESANNTQSANNSNSQAVEEPIVIKMADHLPAGHFLLEPAEMFQRRAEELSGGKIKFEYYPGAQLGGINEMGGLVKDGAVDLGYTLVASASFLPLSSVTGLPSEASDAIQLKDVLDELLHGALAEEWEKANLKPIYLFSNPPNSLLLAKKKVEKAEDLAGMKIRASGGILTKIPELFGGTGVSIGVSDIYEAMQRGVVDGALFPISSSLPYHFDEVTKYVFTGVNFGVVTQAYVINLDVWNKLSPDVQNALLEAGQEATELAAQLVYDQEAQALKTFRDRGVEIVESSPEVKQAMLATMSSLEQAWLEDMSKKGIDGQEVLEAFKASAAKAVQ
jgi:TRAP-type C4-dicarboxylate transport system substrate-binding protein